MAKVSGTIDQRLEMTLRLQKYLHEEHGVSSNNPVESAIELLIKQATLIHNVQVHVAGMIAEGDYSGNASQLAEYIKDELRQI